MTPPTPFSIPITPVFAKSNTTMSIRKDPETTVFAGLFELPVVVTKVGVDLTHPGTENSNTWVYLVSIPITDNSKETV